MSARDGGDEPVLMAQKLPGIPVLTGPRRYLSGKAALRNFAVDCLILDDGFQHRELHRDLVIVLLDGRRPVGNGLLLPAGPLREPPDALCRADVIVLTGIKEADASRALGRRFDHLLRKGTPVFLGRHEARDLIRGRSTDDVHPLAALRGKRLCAFSGIAAPESFRRSLEALGGAITSIFAFPDHHPYTETDICAITDAARRERAAMIVTTEKDGVKLRKFPDFMDRIFLLRITMEINGGSDDFPAWLREKTATWKRP
jgi:tetraacyldisaccharide 4'-kinase